MGFEWWAWVIRVVIITFWAHQHVRAMEERKTAQAVIFLVMMVLQACVSVLAIIEARG